MKEVLPDSKRLSSASTARTYPVGAEKLARTVEEAVEELPGWTLVGSSETEVRALRKSRFPGLTREVMVRLTTESRRRTHEHPSRVPDRLSHRAVGIWPEQAERRRADSRDRPEINKLRTSVRGSVLCRSPQSGPLRRLL